MRRFVLLAAVVAGCSASEGLLPDGGAPDAGADAGPDGGADAGPDGGRDAGPDAGPDGGFDAGPDAGRDAGPDAGPDAGADAGTDAGPDAGPDGGPDAGPDAGELADGGCFLTYDGVEGTCELTSDCSAMGAYTSTAGYCPGPADIQCCTPTPNVADNPPVPSGWVLMAQSMVTTAMTNWAVMILQNGPTYPMYSSTEMTFGTQLVMARVEWHPPDFQNSVVHRGVTLYVPLGDGG